MNNSILSSDAVLYILKVFSAQFEGLILEQEEAHLSQLNQLKDELEKTKKVLTYKDDLFGIIVHDIRSPLAGMRGFTEILINETLDNFDSTKTDDLSQILCGINQISHRLILLVENVSAWRNLEKITPEMSEINLAKEIENSLELSQLTAKSKKINISIIPELVETQKTPILCDKNILGLVLRNLISNAIKFSHRGGKIIISYETFPKTSITIKDFGVGMSPQQISKVLSSNPDLESYPGTEQELGTGFGLKTCLDIIKLVNGSISIKSEPEKGSSFTINL